MKRVLAILLFVVLHVLCYPLAYGQTGNKDLKDVVDKLKAFSSIHITEKVYLHLDKPYYATGDTIYFKAYVTTGERLDLSKISGILRADLINTINKIDQSIKLQLVNGLGWGDFALPDSLPKGNYRIRAYTQWMRNEENYFEQTIQIGTVHDQKIPESSTARSKAGNATDDMQFFAEAGNLINGIRSKIAFKAIGNNGLSIEAKGIVVDNTGKMITQFTSAHLGMGYFYLQPEAGKTYKATITFADGSQRMVSLPLADTKGITLAINNDSLPKATVKIESDPAYYKENKGKDYTLLIYSGGLATTVNLELDSMVTTLDILKRRLHTGITRITLFSPTNEPLCERLMFVQNYDQLNLSLNSDKPVYNPRGKVSIQLNARTRTDSIDIGHFSVSVIDENKVPIEENTETTILTDLLLTSDLKGTVEQPNYYFTNITDITLKNLDLVMLTHGYRRFEWKQVFSHNGVPIAWQPEKSLQISGTAENLLGRHLAKASVSLISFQQNHFMSTVADDKGNFKFDNLAFIDTANFILQAVKAKGGKYTKLIYNQEIPPAVKIIPEQIQSDNSNPLIPAGYLENKQKQKEELKKLNFGKSKMLKEVEIKGKKSDVLKTNPRYGLPDKIITAKQIGYGGQLVTKIAPLFHVPGYHTKPYLIVIDGVEMPVGFDINQINTGSVQTLEVFQDIMGPEYNGVLSFTTSFGLQAGDVVSTGFLPIKVTGYYKAREFYSPNYESTITNTHPDLRSTIYWNPELVTDKDGNASFEYYNADGKGNYRVVIQGMDEKGNLGRQIYRYKVE
jgi:hypothetical protein